VNGEEPSAEAALERAVARVAADVHFVASALRSWCGGILDLEKAAESLGVGKARVVDLALCQRPDPRQRDFASRVASLEAYAAVPAGRLLAVLREATAIEAMQKTAESAMLAAARDRREDE
jgi:hypothetical protein